MSIIYCSNQANKRYLFLDTLRGFALVNMILYHICWNLNHLIGVSLPWYHTQKAELWQLFICGTFLLLAGLCIHFTRHLTRHILILTACATVITVVTAFTGQQTLIVFGILHCMTLCFFFFILLCPIIRHIPTAVGLLICTILFVLTYHIPQHYIGISPFIIELPNEWYVSYWLSILGFLSPDFRSADYFPIFPYLFLFLAGYFLGRLPFPKWMQDTQIKPLTWLGQHSLIVYLLHQPILYILMIWLPDLLHVSL